MLLYLAGTAVLGAAVYVVFYFVPWMVSLQSELEQPIACLLEDPASTKPVPCPSVFDPASKAVSIVVPAYNEQDRLGAALDEALNYLQKRRNKQGPHFTYEVIVVDDGSKDQTARVAFEYVNEYGLDTVRLFRVPRNRGKGHAVKRGVLIARGDYVLIMDADGATRFMDLEKLEEALEKVMTPTYGVKPSSKPTSGAQAADTAGPLGAAFGSRAHLERQAAVKRSKLRNFLMHGFHFLVTLVAGGRIKDTQCGFKAGKLEVLCGMSTSWDVVMLGFDMPLAEQTLFTRRAAAILFTNQRLQRWCFDVELVFLAEQLGIPVAEVFVAWTEMPGSKIRFTSIIHMALELLMIMVAYKITGTWKVMSETQLGKRA